MGAVPDILEQLPQIPVYGTKLTLEMVRKDLEPNQVKKAKLKEQAYAYSFMSGLCIKDVFADFYGSFEPTKTDINQNFIRWI